MSKKLISAQRPFKMLVPVYRRGSDPSRGPAGNPDVKRQTMTMQHFPEIPGRGPETVVYDPQQPGVGTKVGHVAYTTSPIPVGATGTITVLSTTFTGPTTVALGDYLLTSGEDFDVDTGTTYTNEDITNTAPNSALTLFDTAGPNLINAPANLPIVPGTVTINWTSGLTGYSQADDGAGGFSGDGTPASSSIDYTTGAITLDTAALPPDTGSTITITYTAVVTGDDVATNLATAISALPEYSATPAGSVITVTGMFGVLGNVAVFKAGGSNPANFAFSPTEDAMSGAEPALGPVLIG